ncbi:MAG: hypothetical protein ACON4U_07295 [Myxococcota bacterium]
MARGKDSLDSFNVSRIPPHGVSLRLHKETPALVKVLEEMHCYSVEALDGQLLVCKDDRGEVGVTGPLSITLGAVCARCGREIIWKNTAEVDLIYLPDPGGKGMRNEKQLERIKQELELEYESMDIGHYQNGRISILDVIGEHVFMELPSVLRCDSEGVEGDSEHCVLPDEFLP